MLRSVFRAYREAYSGLPRATWLLAGAAFFNRAGHMVLPYLALYLTSQHGYAADQAGRFIGLYGVGAFLGAYLGGEAVDRFDSVRVQIFSLLGTAVGYGILSQAQTTTQIGAVLFGTALVSEAFRPASLASVAIYNPEAVRPRAFGLVRLAVNLGFAMGPTLGGFLAAVSYSWLFAVDAATCLAAGLFLAVTMRGQRAFEHEPSADELAGVRRSPWRDKVFLSILVLLLGIGAIFFQFESTYTLYLHEVIGLSEAGIGPLFAINALTIALFEMLLIKRLENASPLRVVAFGALFVTMGFAGLLLFEHIAWVVVTLLMWTIGEMLTFPILSNVVSSRADRFSRGRYMALYTMAFATAFSTAPILGTMLYEHVSPRAPFAACGVVGLLATAGFFALDRRASAMDAHRR